MGFDGLVSLDAGLLFDQRRARGTSGAGVLAMFVIVGAAYGPLAFAASAHSAAYVAIGGVALWSIAHAATNSIAKAMIAAIVPRNSRGRAYGLYYLVFGVAWWAGSLLLGALYDGRPAFAGVAAVASLALGAAVILASGLGIRKHPATTGNANT
jgi:MFS family permease